MSNNLTATATINIKAPTDKVWEGLTTPSIIKQYFFGTEAVSDWKVGSSLNFKGVWEGKEYLDKGEILQSEPGKLFQYTYLSSFSGLEDKPENYAKVSYELQPTADGTELKIVQEGVATEEAKKHSEQNWLGVMNGLKDLLEK